MKNKLKHYSSIVVDGVKAVLPSIPYPLSHPGQAREESSGTDWKRSLAEKILLSSVPPKQLETRDNQCAASVGMVKILVLAVTWELGRLSFRTSCMLKDGSKTFCWFFYGLCKQLFSQLLLIDCAIEGGLLPAGFSSVITSCCSASSHCHVQPVLLLLLCTFLLDLQHATGTMPPQADVCS